MIKIEKQTVYVPVNVEDVKEYSKYAIDCAECEGLTDDEQYTCTKCWCEGGNGKLHFNDIFKLQEGYFFTDLEIQDIFTIFARENNISEEQVKIFINDKFK